MTNTLGKIIPMDLMTCMRQPAQVFLTAKIEGSVKLSVGISKPFGKTDKIQNEPNIQPTITQSNQSIGPGHIDWDYFPIMLVYIGTNYPRTGWNNYKRTGMNPQGPIVTTILEYNSVNNCDIFDSVRMMSGLSYRKLE